MAPKKITSVVISDEHRALIDAYAKQRGVSRSAALVELALYVIDKSKCPSNPALIEDAAKRVRDTS